MEYREAPNEIDVLMKVLDILKLLMEGEDLRNYEKIQITQVTNQFLPGTTIGDFIQGHSIERQGEVVMGDKYEARGHAQVGAMGKGARVARVTFDGSQGVITKVDLAQLVSELQALRTAMRTQASTTEEDQAIVEVGQAISAAEKGDTSMLLKHLKSAGNWAMSLATSIGAELAAAAIKSTIGL